MPKVPVRSSYNAIGLGGDLIFPFRDRYSIFLDSNIVN